MVVWQPQLDGRAFVEEAWAEDRRDMADNDCCGSLSELFKSVRGSPDGLSSDDAQQLFADIGPNEPVVASRHSAVAQLLSLFVNPLVIILLIASFVSALVGEAASAVIIAVIVLLGTTINFFQTYRSQQAM